MGHGSREEHRSGKVQVHPRCNKSGEFAIGYKKSKQLVIVEWGLWSSVCYGRLFVASHAIDLRRVVSSTSRFAPALIPVDLP